jgi:GTPase
MKNTLKETQKARSKALLVGVQLPRISDEEAKNSLQELKRLVDTLGYQVVGQISQKRPSTRGAVVLGEGKLRTLASWTGGSGVVTRNIQVKKSKAAERFSENATQDNNANGPVDSEFENLDHDEFEDELDAASDENDDSAGEIDESPGEDEAPNERADVVVFDCELTPSQIRNLESATGAQVLDRTGVIIEIFSRHARTRAARLQVEIARLTYLAPRLRETGGGGDRQGGGIGGKGAGETALELDRRRIRDRIKELKDELESVQNESAVRRTRRSEENCVALVGYTNAGKSSLMRAMTGSEILVADQLFATLETTVRPLAPPSQPRILLSDTVGFIKKLPHDLVASFRSTLDEALNADLLLFVVDSSDPAFRSQLDVTMQVIKEIGAGEIASKLVLNKRDRLTSEEAEALRAEFPEAIQLSTRNKEDLGVLREILLTHFEGEMIDADLFVPYQTQGAIGEVRREMRVLEESFNPEGVELRVRARPEALAKFKRKFSLQ